MITPPHIANLKRAKDEAERNYQAATDDPTIDGALLDQHWLAYEILADIYSHEYNDPLNWVVAVEMPITNIVTQPAVSVSILGENA